MRQLKTFCALTIRTISENDKFYSAKNVCIYFKNSYN